MVLLFLYNHIIVNSCLFETIWCGIHGCCPSMEWLLYSACKVSSSNNQFLWNIQKYGVSPLIWYIIFLLKSLNRWIPLAHSISSFRLHVDFDWTYLKEECAQAWCFFLLPRSGRSSIREQWADKVEWRQGWKLREGFFPVKEKHIVQLSWLIFLFGRKPSCTWNLEGCIEWCDCCGTPVFSVLSYAF